MFEPEDAWGQVVAEGRAAARGSLSADHKACGNISIGLVDNKAESAEV